MRFYWKYLFFAIYYSEIFSKYFSDFFFRNIFAIFWRNIFSIFFEIFFTIYVFEFFAIYFSEFFAKPYFSRFYFSELLFENRKNVDFFPLFCEIEFTYFFLEYLESAKKIFNFVWVLNTSTCTYKLNYLITLIHWVFSSRKVALKLLF